MLGGRPRRLLRLTAAGAAALRRLTGEGVRDAADGRLARRLVDAGAYAPVPPARLSTPAPSAVVVVPVHAREGELADCLAALRQPPDRLLVVDDGSPYPDRIAAVAGRYGARVRRREHRGGPAAARNTGAAAAAPLLAGAAVPVLAFVDSDCRVPPGWLDALLPHFADPAVAAVAPRIRAVAPPGARGAAGRFAAAHSPLAMGDRPAEVVPGGAVGYVPSAALLVRADRFAAAGGFDERLRVGEDVDLVWRLHDAGWRVRFDPSVAVEHVEPARWRALLARRFRYGTSAGPLARRHPGRLPPLRLTGAPAAVLLLTLAERPALAGALAAGVTARGARRLRRAGLGRRESVLAPALGLAGALRAAGRTAVQLGWPVLLPAAARRRSMRVPLLTLVVADPLARWWRERPALDPVAWTLACVADDAAYGLGVWAGALAARTAEPLLPRLDTRRRSPGGEL